VGGAGRDGIFVLTFLTLILVTVVGAYRMVWLAFAHTLTDLPASGGAALKWFFVVVLAGAFSLIPVYALFIVLAMFTAGVHLGADSATGSLAPSWPTPAPPPGVPLTTVSPDLNGRALDGLPGNAERIDLQALLEEDGTVTLQYAPGQSGACDEDGTVTTEPRNPRVRGDRSRLGRCQHRLRIRPHHRRGPAADLPPLAVPGPARKRHLQ